MKGKILGFRWISKIPKRQFVSSLLNSSGEPVTYWGEKLLIVCEDPEPIQGFPLLYGVLFAAKNRETLTFLVRSANKKKSSCRVDMLDVSNRQCEQCYFVLHKETLNGLALVYYEGPTATTLSNIIGKIHDEQLASKDQGDPEKVFEYMLIQRPDDTKALVEAMKDVRNVRLSMPVLAGVLELDSHERSCLSLHTESYSFQPKKVSGGVVWKAIEKLRARHGKNLKTLSVQFAAQHGLETLQILDENIQTFGRFPVDEFSKGMQLVDVVADFPNSAPVSALRSVAKKNKTLLATEL